MSPEAKYLARMAKERDSAVKAAQAESGWAGPNYVKPTHYYPPGNLGNPNKIAASSSPAPQPQNFSKMRKRPKGKR